MGKRWTTEENSRASHAIRLPLRRKNDWEQFVLIQGDQHIDNPHCKLSKLQRHLAQAVERDAPVIGIGDLFCAMQGRNDPRRSRKSLKKEHATTDDYFDVIIDEAVDVYGEAAENLAVFGSGNHETSVTRNTGTNLLHRWAYRLQKEHGAAPFITGYTGWIKFKFFDEDMIGKKGGFQRSVNLKYYHDPGSSGVVSRGSLSINRNEAQLSNADIVVGGHIHESWVMHLFKEHLTSAGKIEKRHVMHLVNPTYKDEFDDGFGGYHIQKRRSPRPIGATWLRFYWEDRQIKYDAHRAT